MRRSIAVLVLATLVGWAHADELDPRKKALIDEALELTGALEVGQLMSNMVVDQMASALKASNPETPARAFELMSAAVNDTINASIEAGEFQELLYPIYDKHFRVSDLEAMIAFYRTEAGQRINEVMPAMTREAMLAGQQWGEKLGPQIGAEVRRRLEAEDIEFSF